MTTCFVVSTTEDEAAAVYEFSASTVSLLNNRHFRSAAADDADARKIVEEHAPKFLTMRTAITEIAKHDIRIGTYHPSIARPIYPTKRQSLVNLDFANQKETVARLKRDIGLLSHDLEECFDVSSPHTRNLGVFGTSYESIILFACIGIENLFLRVLRANKTQATRKNHTMEDFIMLKSHLRLNEYETSLARYPWLEPFAPFAEWEPRRPPQWFFAYNKLKHDKEQYYDHATMKNAIDACLAYWIVLHAVFGHAVDNRVWSSDDDDFYLTKRPIWNWNQCYFEAADGEWHSVPAAL